MILLTNGSVVFADLCTQMFRILENQGCMEEWARLESQAYGLLQDKQLYLDKHVVRPALLGSGSGRILRIIREQIHEDSYQRFLDSDAVRTPFRTLENLSNDDIMWLLPDMRTRILRAAIQLVMTRQCRDYTAMMAKDQSLSFEQILAQATDLFMAPWPQMNNLAPEMAAGLRERAATAEGHNALMGSLDHALSIMDLRAIAILLCLNLNIGQDELPSFEKAPDILKDVFRLQLSQHGRLKLHSMEPDLESILARPDEAAFYGITGADLAQATG